MTGLKISELPSVTDLRDTDLLVLSRGRTTRRIAGEVFRVGIERVQGIENRVNELFNNTIFARDSNSIEMFYNSRTRELSASIKNDIILSPQPLIRATNLETFNTTPSSSLFFVTDKMHGKVYEINSTKLTEIYLPDDETYNGVIGITVTFLRKGMGRVRFKSFKGSTIHTFPDSSYNEIAYKNAVATVYYAGGGEWFLNGNLGSDTEGDLSIDTGLLYDEQGEAINLPTPTAIPPVSATLWNDSSVWNDLDSWNDNDYDDGSTSITSTPVVTPTIVQTPTLTPTIAQTPTLTPTIAQTPTLTPTTPLINGYKVVITETPDTEKDTTVNLPEEGFSVLGMTGGDIVYITPRPSDTTTSMNALVYMPSDSVTPIMSIGYKKSRIGTKFGFRPSSESALINNGPSYLAEFPPEGSDPKTTLQKQP
jgi:hypothetical protein